MSRKTVFIIDAHSQIYKAYYAIRHLSNSRGLPTNAIYGFVQMLNRLVREMQPKIVVAVFDHPAPTFREEIYKGYKATRPPMPDDLSVQMPWIKKILTAMNIQCIEVPGYEADDIIGSLARRAAHEHYDCYIVSSDKDLFQLVGDNVHLLQLKNDKFETIDREKVKEKMNVYPEAVPDLIGLMGDSIDNIPGVPQIGPKTASALLAEFGTLENLLAHVDKVNNERQRQRLQEHQKAALLSKKLAIIDRAVPLAEIQLEGLPEINRTSPTLLEYYRELEFKTLLKETKTTSPAVSETTNYVTVQTIQEIRRLLRRAGEARIIAVDTETTSQNPFGADLVGISISHEEKSAFYVPIGHRALAESESLILLAEVRHVLEPLLSNPFLEKCFHNAKYDIEVLANHGIAVQGVSFDTMLASYLLNPDRGAHGLKDIAAELLGVSMTPLSDLIGTGKNSITMAEVPIKDASDYACRDADVTLRLMQYLEPKLRESQLATLFHNVEMPLVEVLCDMEAQGVCIDVPYFRHLSEEMAAKLAALEKEIFGIAGHAFNLSSPKQVADVLFNELKLRPVKSGKTGYSTDVTVLEELSASHALPQRLLEYRMYEKLKSTYVDTLPELVNPKTGKIHTSYNQSIAATGRLVSSNPNLQNIPVRTPEGRQIRRGFIPQSAGNVLLAADYSQIELRILAHVSQDENLSRAFREGQDIHKMTASKIFGCPLEMITPEMRDQAKIINFGIIYGMTAHRVARDFKIPLKAAQAFMDEYFAAYSGVKRWIESTLEFVRKNGFVITLLNRRRYLPNIASRSRGLRLEAERAAINMPIQGTSADMIKKAMLQIHRELRNGNFHTRMIMQVHDELIFDAPEDEIERVSMLVKDKMENALKLNVPIRVDVKQGRNWEEC